MDPRLKAKSDLYVFAGYVALLAALAFNPFTIPLLQNWGIVPTLNERFMHSNDILILLPISIDIILIAVGLIIIRSPRPLKTFFNDSIRFNLFLLLASLLFLFSSNVILPGTFKILRILLLLTIIFLLTNSLYLLVIKKRKESIHAFYKNLALAAYSVLLTLLILEGVFLFFQSTHRFNGTLASQAWFLKHWELNEEGYRDGPYEKEKIEGKRKVMVLGDSFVAGHGIEDPEDRFSNILARKLSDYNRVFNLGVGGSDVLDAYHRLKDFPYTPDFLIFSYYPNDIEQDGERAGLEIARARSYSDLPLPLRYFFRRSYLLNNIYWRYPHGEEMAGFKTYVEQCYADSSVMNLHKAHLDSLVDHAETLGIPMLAIVWPFLERVEWSEFATQPILEYFEERGVYTFDVRNMVLDRPVEDLIVNSNDSHPNQELNAELADSLYELMLDYSLLD